MPDEKKPLQVNTGGKPLSDAAQERIREAIKKTIAEEIKKEGATNAADVHTHGKI